MKRQTRQGVATSHTKGNFTMRGFVRLGALGLVIGLMFMVSAPTDARAMTPISLFDINDPFPENVTGDAALPQEGIIVAYNVSQSPRFSAFNFENGNLSLNGFGSDSSSPTFGLIVAFSQQLGLQLFPFSDGPANPGANAPGGSQGMPGDTGSVDDGTVTHAPEPATWIMMIFGFWIVAWRLRRRAHNIQGSMAVPA